MYPQKEADKKSPELSLKTAIKIPVYQKKIIDLTSYIYEDSWIKNIKDVFIDFDLDIDSDWDWNPRNDEDSKEDEKINIIHDIVSVKVEFGKFEELFTKKIWVWLIDDNDNGNYTEIDFLVYPPLPSISEYNNWTIKWKIDENLQDEPINLYRYRWWMISKLENSDWSNLVNTIDNWNYIFEVWEDKENEISELKKGLNLKVWDTLVAYINENTWIIEAKAFPYSISVISSNNALNQGMFPKIILSYKDKQIPLIWIIQF